MGLIQGISRSIINLLPGGIVVSNRDSILKRTIAAARKALNIHPEQQTGSAYLVQKTPTIAGVVQDETPARKDRTRLSCRASDFAVNQYFNGPVDIAGWTELSISCWIRHGEVAANMYAMGSYGTTIANRSFVLGVLGSGDKPRFRLYDNSGAADAEIDFPANSTNDNSWHLLTATYDFATETVTGYIDGRDVTAASTVTAGTNGSINTSQNPSDFTIGSLLQSPTSYDWNGQLQQPLIYEGIWSAAQVRDLYLQQTDDIPTTYGWFLDGDSASGLTSSSPALTPSNSPTIYEDDAVGGGDWLNEKGWNPVTKFDGDLITITDGLEVDFSKDVKIKMSVNYTTLSNSMELFEFAPNKNARTHFTTRLLWVLTGTGDVTTTGGDPTFTSDVWYDLEFDFVASSGTMTISVNDVVKATLAGQSPAAIQTLNNIGGGSTPLTALVSGFEVYEDNVKIFRLDGLVDSVGGLPLTVGAGISELNYPKRWDEELDSAGQPAANSDSFGVARRDGQLVDGACISLDGVNQYGTITNTTDFSGEDWTLSGRFVWDGVSSTRVVFSQLTGTSWLYSVNGVLKTNLGAGHTFAITTLLTAKEYAWEIEKSGSDFTLRITNVTDDLTQEAETISLTMASSTGDFMIGENTAGSNHFGGKMWDLKLDHANGFELPMAEGSGTTSYDVSGNGKDCTWVNSPSWGSQSSYFWNENKGCSAIWDVTSATDAAAGPEIVGAPIEAGVSISLEIKTTDRRGMLFGNNAGTSPFGLIWSNGDVTTSLTIGMGTPTITIDGIVYTDGVSTRDDLNSVISTGAWVTIELTGVDTSSFSNGLFLSGVYVSNWTWNGQVRNLVINGEPFDGPLLIPALAAGTNDANGGALTNPAGPWLYEGLGSTYVNFDVVANANQWLEQRWIGAEFDGVSSSTLLSGSFDWNQSFDISLNYRLADHALAEYLFCNSNTLVYSLRTSGGRPQFRNGGTTFMYSQAGSLTDFNDLRVTYTGGQTGDIEITLNGVTETFTNDAGSPPASNQIRFGSDGAVSAFTEGEIRTLAVTNGASDYYDSPLLGCSLDLSSQVNHGTDTDVVYNRLTDVSYQAGDTVEQPFSVNDDTAGRVSELIQFTFPKV